MENRRDFIKKIALLAGSTAISPKLMASIEKAAKINPEIGSSFYDAEHIVIMMLENRSFDHSFGTLQGVRGFNDPRAIKLPNKNKVWLQSDISGNTYAPFRLDIKNSKITWMGCLPHNWTDQTDAFNKAKMDQWLKVKQSAFKEFASMPLTMGYYTREDIPFYYGLADAFTVCDQNFCSSLTGTNPNRLYFWSGNIKDKTKNDKFLVWNGDSEFSGKANWKTFPERLQESGIDWKIYQNEISASSYGYTGEENSWLGNFGCNVMEYFPQYKVKYSKRYKTVLVKQKKDLEEKIKTGNEEEKAKLQEKLKFVNSELEIYQNLSLKELSEYEKELHQRAFINNDSQANYMELETLNYQDNGKPRSIRIPKGDILYQFRKDVDSGNLPLISWMVPPQLFSDHPDSPRFGSWYVSEVFNILTKNPEVWKKTIFILTYDENDGYFDHVPPFTVPDPNLKDSGKTSKNIHPKEDYVNKEDQNHPDDGRTHSVGLGYRIPMIIASPWSRGGWVNSQIYDHTSTLQFLENFISQKTGKLIHESNITEWRRSICGDITSAFRPYHGESVDFPQPLERLKFIEEIHQAKFKKLPDGYTNLSPDLIALANNSKSNSVIPKQEPGIRPSNALPYELYADRVASQNGNLSVLLKAGNQLFGDKASGSPFRIYCVNDYNGEKMYNRNYAVTAGDQISDQWEINQFKDSKYHLEVYGPNGFFRRFKGSLMSSQILTKCSFETNKSGLTNLILTINNQSRQLQHIEVVGNSYGNKSRRLKIKSGQQKEIKINLKSNYNWYDISVKIKGIEEFEDQFCGHIENGSHSFSDPLMGGLI